MDWKKTISMLERAGLLGWLPTSVFLKQKYRRLTGHGLNLKAPRTFNEKLQWLKLYYAKNKDLTDLYTALTDKISAKDIVGKIIGMEHIIPTLGVWDHFDDIDFDSLPDQFVLKTNHDSGGIVVCSDKSKLDKNAAKKKLEHNLSRNFYWFGREPQYKNIKPRIFAEQYMTDDSGYDLKDYKIHCFNGVPKIILVCRNRFESTGLTDDFFSPQWEHLDVRRPKHPNSPVPIREPEELAEMLQISEKLAENKLFVRVDLYTVNGMVFFGELTFFPASGFSPFDPESWDEKLGDWLTLPQK